MIAQSLIQKAAYTVWYDSSVDMATSRKATLEKLAELYKGYVADLMER